LLDCDAAEVAGRPGHLARVAEEHAAEDDQGRGGRCDDYHDDALDL
jgi:hypothetical protein